MSPLNHQPPAPTAASYQGHSPLPVPPGLRPSRPRTQAPAATQTALCPWPAGLEPIVGPVKTASVRPAQPQAPGQARLEPRLSWEGRVHGSSDQGGGARAGSTTSVPAWHCQPPSHKPEPPDTPGSPPSPHILPGQPPDSRPCPAAEPQLSDPHPASKLIFPAHLASRTPPPTASPASSPSSSPALPSCPKRSRGRGQRETSSACLTMRMSAVMAQLENSSVSPTKMQICPGETRATVRGRSTHHGPPRLLPAPWAAAGREPQKPPAVPGSHTHTECVHYLQASRQVHNPEGCPEPWAEQGHAEPPHDRAPTRETAFPVPEEPGPPTTLGPSLHSHRPPRCWSWQPRR